MSSVPGGSRDDFWVVFGILLAAFASVCWWFYRSTRRSKDDESTPAAEDGAPENGHAHAPHGH